MRGPETIPGRETDRVQEACGVAAVYIPKIPGQLPIAHEYAVEMITQLGHRGDEGTGIATWPVDNQGMIVLHGEGDANQAFGKSSLLGMDSYIAMSHGRYATSNMNNGQNGRGDRAHLHKTIQPMVVDTKFGRVAQGHNGDIANADELADYFEMDKEMYASDSDFALDLLKEILNRVDDPIEAFRHVSHLMVGAYSMTTMINDRLFAWRDPWGFRPLYIGTIPNDIGNTIWTVASEQPAFESLGGTEYAPVGRGELVEFTDDGPVVYRLFSDQELALIPESFCSFEDVYFSRPDSRHRDVSVAESRLAAGRQLAIEHPAPDGAIVIGTPNSGSLAGQGFAEQSSLPDRPGIVKNPKDKRRAFLEANQDGRAEAAASKSNPNRAVVAQQIVVRVDDSSVRGHTAQNQVEALRRAGALEVHERYASPPYRHCCKYGMDTKVQDELIASRMNQEEMRQDSRADSLAHLSVQGFYKALETDEHGTGYCTMCMTGEDPTASDDQQTMRKEYLAQETILMLRPRA